MLTVSSVIHKEWLEDKVSLDYYEFFADEDSDLPTGGEYTPDEPTDITYKIAQGSMGYVISTSTMYLLNSEGSWVEQESSGGGGGGGGTTNYEQLSHKPQINGTTLSGNKSLSDLGIAAAADIPSVPVQSVSKNGTAITPSAQGNVNITVPTQASDVNALPSDTKYAGSATQGGSATSAAKLDTASAGSATQPVYFTNGVPTATTYSLEKSVPSNAVFTDTTYTLAAGTGDDADKVVLTPSSGSAQKITVPYATSAGSASSASAVAWSGVSSKPSTISGYGITDAKIANGVVTLGANTITPLTSHQSVTDNNPTLAWNTKSKVATIGNTDINVTMPAQPSYTASDVGLGNVTNNAQVKKIGSSTSGNIMTWSGTTGDTPADSGVSIEASSSGISDSDAKIPTSKDIRNNIAGSAKLTGYAKTTGNVAASDTVTTAIGKLETKADNNTTNIGKIQTQALKIAKEDTGRNCFNNTATTATKNNITFTVNADKSVTLTATQAASADTYFELGYYTSDGITRKLMGAPSGSSTSKWWLFGGNSVDDVGSGVNITNSSTIYIIVKSGQTPNNVTFKPMITTQAWLDAGFTDFQPYALPNTIITPELIELVDSGAKNLCNNILATGTISSNVTATVSIDKQVTLSGSTPSNADASFTISTNVQFPAGTYIGSGCPSGGATDKYRIDYVVNDSTVYRDTGNGVEFTLNNASNVRSQLVVYRGNAAPSAAFKPMICTKAAWDVSQKFVPYRPSYEETVEQAATNKTNISSSYSNGYLQSYNLYPYGTLTGTGSLKTVNISLPAGTYKISWKANRNDKSSVMTFKNGGTTVAQDGFTNSTSKQIKTITLSTAVDSVELYSNDIVTLSDIMIIDGTMADSTPYRAYTMSNAEITAWILSQS